MIEMNKLDFKFIAEHDRIIEISPDEEGSYSIPDQIVVLVDGKEILDDYCGMYPSDFFSQNIHFFKGNLQIGICGCSAYGDSDEYAKVDSNDDIVFWKTDNGKKYLFDKKEYTEIIDLFTKKYGENELFSTVNDILTKEYNNKILATGILYKTFRFYWYGHDIILFFEKYGEEKEMFIHWKKDINILKEKLKAVKEEDIY